MNNHITTSRRLVHTSENTATKTAHDPDSRVTTPNVKPQNHQTKVVIWGLSPGGVPTPPGSKRYIKTMGEIMRIIGENGKQETV